MDKLSIAEELQRTGKYMMDYSLAWGNAGNISARTSSEEFLITASGTFLGELSLDDFVKCNVNRSNQNKNKKPSKEVPMHKAIYESRPDIGAVLHSSPFYSTLIACSNLEIPSNLFVETMYYLEKVERIRYYHPGSLELGKGVEEKAKKTNVLLLENHGVLVYDQSLKEARMALQTLEMTCKMLVLSSLNDLKLSKISKENELSFLESAAYKPRREWPINS